MRINYTAKLGSFKCKICGKKGTKKGYTQKFCEKCGIKYQIKKTKERVKEASKRHREAKLNEKPPEVACPHCGIRFKIDFIPRFEPFKWKEVRCPKCNKLRTEFLD